MPSGDRLPAARPGAGHYVRAVRNRPGRGRRHRRLDAAGASTAWVIGYSWNRHLAAPARPDQGRHRLSHPGQPDGPAGSAEAVNLHSPAHANGSGLTHTESATWELGGPAYRSRSATAAVPRPVRKYLPFRVTAAAFAGIGSDGWNKLVWTAVRSRFRPGGWPHPALPASSGLAGCGHDPVEFGGRAAPSGQDGVAQRPWAWNRSWNGSVDSPSAASAVSAISCAISAASACRARDRVSRNA
jgi:hypothetical protein